MCSFAQCVLNSKGVARRRSDCSSSESPMDKYFALRVRVMYNFLWVGRSCYGRMGMGYEERRDEEPKNETIMQRWRCL